MTDRLLALLLRAYPRSFRRRHGEQMALFLAEERHEARYRGRLGALRFTATAGFDLARGALRARHLERRPSRPPAAATVPPPPGRKPMGSFVRDLRFAGRALGKRPAWTLAAAATLAIGLGASSAIYSLVHGVLLAPLPYPASDELLSLQAFVPEMGRTRGSVSYPVYEAIRDAEDSTTGLGCYSVAASTVDLGGGAERMRGALASAQVFRALGVPAAAGRVFQDADDEDAAAATVVLGHGLWQERFAGDPAVIGRVVQIDDRPTEVIGVMPAGFAFPDHEVRFWRPMAGMPRPPTRHYLQMIGRLRPGLEADTATARLAGVLLDVPTGAPGNRGIIRVRAQPFLETLVGAVRPQLVLFMLAVAGVLAIGCINVANLMLGRAAARSRELSLRAALGAGRLRLMRQVLAETLLLGVFGGLLGLVVAVAVERGLLALANDQLPRGGSSGTDLRAFAFAAVLSLLVGLAVGLLPAMRASRPDLRDGLADGGRGTLGAVGRHRLRAAMAAAQLALAAMLLANAGVLTVSLSRLSAVETGLDTTGVLTFRPALGSVYETVEQRRAFYAGVDERLRSLPGVAAVGFTATAPFGGGHIGERLLVEGTSEPASPEDETVIDVQIVDHRFFAVVGIDAVAGRLLEAGDGSGPRRRAVVSARFARTFFSDPNGAIGETVEVGSYDRVRRLEIVGVVPDVLPYSLVRPVEPMLWEPLGTDSDEWRYGVSFAVRVAGGDIAAAAAAIPDLVRAADPGVPVAGLTSLDQRVDRQLALPRLRTRVITVFAAAALLLALIGVYGVMAFLAVERTREIGLRLALGARRGQVLRWLARRGAAITAVGLALGVVAARAGARLLEGYLFELQAFDLRIVLSAGLILALAALAAVYLPARRASRLDPVTALRTE